MLFKNYTEDFKQITHEILELKNVIQGYMRSADEHNFEMTQKFIDMQDKFQENIKKVNDMTLELKGVISQARAALSERKAFDDFMELANGKIIEMTVLAEKRISKRVDNELLYLKKMIEKLVKAYDEIDINPYAKLTACLGTLERIEEVLENQNKKPKAKTKKNVPLLNK